MSVFNQQDLTQKYKQNIYNIALDVSGWDTVTFQVVAPVAATLYIYGAIDDNMPQGSLLASNNNYKPSNVINWTPVQAVQLATGSAVTSITTAGVYSVPVNAPFLKIGGGGADVYGLWQNNLKIG
jgi:hypothetical protein